MHSVHALYFTTLIDYGYAAHLRSFTRICVCAQADYIQSRRDGAPRSIASVPRNLVWATQIALWSYMRTIS